MESAPSAGGSFKPGGEEQPKSIDEAQRMFDQRSQTFEAAGADCTLLCKALSSMQRAAEHLCQLVAEGGPTDRKRCDDAKQRVVSARAKVTQMCGNCEDRQ